MIGLRLPDDTAPWELKAADYCFRGEGDQRFLWVCLPSGVGPSRLKGWDVAEHEDGTVTVSPSILDSGTENGWHGYLERGVWREV